MVIDTSALYAILSNEPEAVDFEQAIVDHPRPAISAATLFECSIVVEAGRGDAGGRELDLYVHKMRAEIVPVDEEQAQLARAAYRKYGKGRHRAGLNFGDCFSYALAVSRGEALLFKGEDFALTDVVPALER